MSCMRSAPVRHSRCRWPMCPRPVVREYQEIEREKARARMNRIVARVGIDARRLSTTLCRGTPSRSALAAARSFEADLIVCGKQGRSAMAEFLLGGVTRRLLSGSSCDMLIVPRAAMESLQSTAPAIPMALGAGSP